MIRFTGLDDAIIGLCERIGEEDRLAYSTSEIINILIERDGMSEQEAIEFFSFNILDSYLGDTTPCFITYEDNYFGEDFEDDAATNDATENSGSDGSKQGNDRENRKESDDEAQEILH